MSDRSSLHDRDSLRDRLQRKSIEVPRDRIRAKQSDTPKAETAAVVKSKRVNRKVEYQAIKGELHERLIDELNRQGLLTQDDSGLKAFTDEFVANILENEDWPLNDSERLRLPDDLLEETLGTGPLAPLMGDPAVTDILVNRFDSVFVERFGVLEPTEIRFRDEEHLVRIIGRIAARVGRRIDTSSPMVDARLPDGSRVNATLPPVTIDGPTLSIRRFGRRRLERADLVRLGMFSDAMDQFMETLVRHRKSLIVTGGTGSGKSTLLGAIAAAIPDSERIITIEDAAELMLGQEHVIRMETRAPNTEGKGAITQRDLVVNALRMRPDRVVMGEVRAGEALDMLQAMNTGHDGSLTTVHANSPRDAFARLETMVMMAGMELPSQAIREQAVSAINYIVHVRRYEDGVRRIERIAEVVGIESKTPQLQDIFVFKPTGRADDRIIGTFQSTGVVPRIVNELSARGIADVNRSWFARQST
jgi:pilus assembly protein CpaF